MAQFFEYPLLSQERVKLRTSNMASIFRVSMRTKVFLKIWEKRERGRIQGLSKFFEYPILSEVYSQGLSEQKPLKNLGEKGAWAYPGTSELKYPLLSQFQFCKHILSIDRNKSPLQISGKVAVPWASHDFRNFLGHTCIYWAHRAVVFAIA